MSQHRHDCARYVRGAATLLRSAVDAAALADLTEGGRGDRLAAMLLSQALRAVAEAEGLVDPDSRRLDNEVAPEARSEATRPFAMIEGPDLRCALCGRPTRRVGALSGKPACFDCAPGATASCHWAASVRSAELGGSSSVPRAPTAQRFLGAPGLMRPDSTHL